MPLVIFLCSLFLASGLSAQPREGDIMWRPQSERSGIQTTYVQGPWAVQWQGNVYVGGHAGYFGPPWIRDGGERPYVIAYGPERVTAVDNVLVLPPHTQEFGFGTMVRWNGWWVYSGVRTDWSTAGERDRAVGMIALAADPVEVPYAQEWFDLTAPGQIMSALVVINDTLLLFRGTEIWSADVTPDSYPRLRRIGTMAFLPWSDVAFADGKLYALVSKSPKDCYWWDCFEVGEFISDDYGTTWNPSDRHWSIGGLPGGVLPYTGDACYVRDELGHINRDALTVIALVTPNPDPASGTWRLHYWVDSRAQLPATWGHEPGYYLSRIRRKLK